MTGHDIVVIGASAGGLQPAMQILRELPPDLAASVLLVVHTTPDSERLARVIARASAMPASNPADGDRIERGAVYVAPPDYHMMVDDSRIRLNHGPKENRFRPAVDPLFRSAALACGPRVIGIVLSGAMSDGAAGLAAIKDHGGVAIVQDPNDALIPGMPGAALRAVEADYTLPASGIADTVARLVQAPPRRPAGVTMPKQPEEPIGVSCPDCDGGLFQLHEGKLDYFTCRIGHRFTIDSLIDDQCERAERALWVAVRSLEERAVLLERAAAKTPEDGRAEPERKMSEAREKARAIRELAER